MYSFIVETTKKRPIFKFRLKSSGFHNGLGKPCLPARQASKEYFTEVKAAWTVRPCKVRRFKEI